MKLNHYLNLSGLMPTFVIASDTHEHSHGGGKFCVGEPGNGSPGRRVVVSMHDSMAYAFEPELSSQRHCETIEFILTSNGAIQHEFSIGNAD